MKMHIFPIENGGPILHLQLCDRWGSGPIVGGPVPLLGVRSHCWGSGPNPIDWEFSTGATLAPGRFLGGASLGE